MGQTHTNLNITVPAYIGRLQGSQLSWNFTSTSQSTLGGIAPSLAQGNGFGGGTAINVMAYCRGSRSVFDEWADISGIGELRWENLMEYFAKSTQLTVPSDLGYGQVIDSTGFGDDHVHVSYPNSAQYVPIDPAFVRTCTANGAKDIDMTSGEGIAYGFELAGRSNVELLYGARVKKINFEGTKAVGVDYVMLTDNQTPTVLAKETIVNAGAINSPRLLLLSSVGPKDHLADVGVPLVVDSPGVDNNFFDHRYIVMLFNATPDLITASKLDDPAILAP